MRLQHVLDPSHTIPVVWEVAPSEFKFCTCIHVLRVLAIGDGWVGVGRTYGDGRRGALRDCGDVDRHLLVPLTSPHQVDA
jgi:hypothetical protein